jgi:AraC-like DNA-binding protein
MFDTIRDSNPDRMSSPPLPPPAAPIRTGERAAIFPHLSLNEIYRLNETQVLKGSTSHPMDIVLDGKADHVVYIFVLDGVIERHNTRSHLASVIPDGGAGAVINGPATLLKLSKGCRWLAFQIPLSLLRNHFGLWSGQFCFHEPRFATVADFRRHAVSSLYRTINFLLLRKREGEGSPLANSYEQLLIAQLYASAPHNLCLGDRSARQPCPKQLRRAEEFIRSNLYASITVDHIAGAAGCSTRTLQRIFRHFRDATPTQILSHYRIAEAHDLITAGRARTVTDLASSLQFSNPARFAATYRDIYGQKPSIDIRAHLRRGVQKATTI